MLRKVLLGLILLAGTAHAQNAVRQTGPVTAGDLSLWANDHFVSSAAQRLNNTGLGSNPFTITDSLGPGITLNSANTSGQYNSLTIGHDASGNPLFTVDSFGGLPNKTPYLRLNGTLYQFPFSTTGVVGPNSTTIGHVALWNNTNGTLLQDGGLSYPFVTDNATLQTISTVATAYQNGVWRQDFAAGKGAPPLLYLPSGSACALNGGNGDNGAQVKSSDNKCWLAHFPTSGYDPREWGADGSAATDSVAAIQAAASWIGANSPGGVLNCGSGGNSVSAGVRYLIGQNATPGNPLFTLSEPVDFYRCYFLVTSAMTATTDIFLISPNTDATDGWGFEYLTIFQNTDTGHWRHTFAFSDGGNNQKQIRGLKFHDVNIYPSQNRAGNDMNLTATAGGTGLLVQSTIGPNVNFYECIYLHNLGDSVNITGTTVATDGAISSTKCGFDITNTGGAGETSITGSNFTTYGGSYIGRNVGAGDTGGVYGFHMDGSVFECESSALASPNNAFLTIAKADGLRVTGTQFQAGGCTTPPLAFAVDATSVRTEIRPVYGGTLASPKYTVGSIANQYVEDIGHQPNRPFAYANMNANQTLTSGVFGLVVFDTTTDAPNWNYYSVSTGKYTPLIAGTYYASTTVCMTGTFSAAAFQIILQKNSGSGAGANLSAPSMLLPAGAGTWCQSASGITAMNGTTDWLDVAGLSTTSAGSPAVVGNQESSFSIFRLGP